MCSFHGGKMCWHMLRGRRGKSSVIVHCPLCLERGSTFIHFVSMKRFIWTQTPHSYELNSVFKHFFILSFTNICTIYNLPANILFLLQNFAFLFHNFNIFFTLSIIYVSSPISLFTSIQELIIHYID